VAQSKALEFVQKRVLNIIFSSGAYATNLIIANVKIPIHDDSYSHSFSSVGHELGDGLLAPFRSATDLVPIASSKEVSRQASLH